MASVHLQYYTKVSYVPDFAATFNNALHLFEDDYLDGILQRHLDGQSFLDATSYAAFNIVLAQSLRKFDNMRPDAAEKCFENAFSILPVMMMQSPNKASIATMLFMVLILVLRTRPSLLIVHRPCTLYTHQEAILQPRSSELPFSRSSWLATTILCPLKIAQQLHTKKYCSIMPLYSTKTWPCTIQSRPHLRAT